MKRILTLIGSVLVLEILSGCGIPPETSSFFQRPSGTVMLNPLSQDGAVIETRPGAVEIHLNAASFEF